MAREPFAGHWKNTLAEAVRKRDKALVRNILMRHLFFPLFHDQGLIVLQRHIFDLQREIFTKLLAVVQHIPRTERVHVHLNKVIVFYRNDGIAHTLQIGNDPGNIK